MRPFSAYKHKFKEHETLAQVLANISAPAVNLDVPGGPVSADDTQTFITDASGNGRHATWSGGGFSEIAPSYRTNIRNGLPAMHFKGVTKTFLGITSQNLNTGWGITTAWTLYAAFKFATAANRDGGLPYFTGASSPFAFMPYWSDGHTYMQAGPTAGSAYLDGTPTVTNNWEVWCCHGTSGGTWEALRNGISVISATKTNTVSSVSGTVFVGTYAGSNPLANCFVGYLGDIIIFNTDHNTTTRYRMQRALMRRWAITNP